MDLNLLVAFDALLAERSVTRAATRLSVGQSAMSSTLGRLRKLLGDPLLVKDGRAMVATPFAESLVQPVRQVLISIEGVLAHQRDFVPARDTRTFSVIANDYVTMTFLHPLLARLDTEAPGVRLHVSPTGDDFVERLQRHQCDLLILPREAFSQAGNIEDFPHRVLFRDRYVCAVDQNHPDVGDELTLEQFSTLPYLAAAAGSLPSLPEIQLDFLGVPRNTEMTTTFGVAPFLLKGTRLITVIAERLARQIAPVAGLRLLEPPVPQLQPFTEVMLWTPRNEGDPAHQWLRRRLLDLAAELS
ncbi:LysR family transcriptional regulator [Streptomyces sp. NPDC101455]|uniref:LysR family transcriptional regulator n=1 Tax=Streptomyces sp. NPDC101455 TaxID=3366142 RepID=UPI00382D5E0A